MTHIEEEYNWMVGPCAGMTWEQWHDIQIQLAQDNAEANTQNATAVNEDINNNADASDINDNVDDNADDNDNIAIQARNRSRAAKRQTSPKLRKVLFPITTANIDPQPEPETAAKHVAPKKMKTRAERRFEEPESEDEELSNFITPQKGERRTVYWAFQNDLRMKRMRRESAFKMEELLI